MYGYKFSSQQLRHILHRFYMLYFHFHSSFGSVFSKVSFEIYPLIHGLFRNVLLSLQVIRDFLIFFFFFTDFYFDSNVIKNILCMISVTLNLLRFALWSKIWFFFVYVSWRLQLLGRVFCKCFNPMSWPCHQSSISLLIFCLVILSVVERHIEVIVDLSISFSSSKSKIGEVLSQGYMYIHEGA